MEILQGLAGLHHVPRGCALSIGNFDGVHRGHQHILEIAREAGGPVVLVTFEPHPLTVLRPQAAPPRLTPLDLKESLLARMGVNYLVVLPPDPAVLNLTAEQFWALIRDHARPAMLVEGDNFTFGKNRGGTIELLKDWAADAGIALHIASPVKVPLLDMNIAPVSSTLVRWLLANGRARDAAICLGRAYELVGEVVQGHQRGRTIGIPTANLRCGDQFIPAEGVYAGRCTVGHKTWPAAVSIGTMPTFGEHEVAVEAHLIGFDGDLYGNTLSVEVLDYLREQRKFGSVEMLKGQLGRDLEEVRGRGDMDPSIPIAC
jgi:riboflavin kinase/FMN adenylyltransferase